MEKVFEDLEILLKARQLCSSDCATMCENCQKHSAYNSIKQVLTELKAIKETNPSEALDYLYNSKMFEYVGDEAYFLQQYNAVKSAQLKAQEQDEALKIIFEKNVDINWFTTFKGTEFYTYERYVSSHKTTKLTQEEFDLLKRWNTR